MLYVVNPGPQSTLQGAPRVKHRHYGIPYAGPADPLSMAFGNKLVGNSPDATAIEITSGDFQVGFNSPCAIAITGAECHLDISGRQARSHKTLHVHAGAHLALSPLSTGMRTYLAIAGGFKSDTIFDSTSTYMPARLGGLSGRALCKGDTLETAVKTTFNKTVSTPAEFRQKPSNSYILRACPSAETHLLPAPAKQILFNEPFKAGRQITRMGIPLEGNTIETKQNGLMESAPVYPGTIQCPPSGVPIVLLCDAQTTGGYPRAAQIARCDRHLLGQIRPGDKITLLSRTPDAAIRDYKEKMTLLQTWLRAPGWKLC